MRIRQHEGEKEKVGRSLTIKITRLRPREY